jgi:hypothetical protein
MLHPSFQVAQSEGIEVGVPSYKGSIGKGSIGKGSIGKGYSGSIGLGGGGGSDGGGGGSGGPTGTIKEGQDTSHDLTHEFISSHH